MENSQHLSEYSLKSASSPKQHERGTKDRNRRFLGSNTFTASCSRAVDFCGPLSACGWSLFHAEVFCLLSQHLFKLPPSLNLT